MERIKTTPTLEARLDALDKAAAALTAYLEDRDRTALAAYIAAVDSARWAARTDDD